METCVILGNIGPDLEHLCLELRYQNEGLKEELEDKAGKRLDNRFNIACVKTSTFYKVMPICF